MQILACSINPHSTTFYQINLEIFFYILLLYDDVALMIFFLLCFVGEEFNIFTFLHFPIMYVYIRE